jgi:integrase
MSIRKHEAKSGAISYYVYVNGPEGKPVYVGKRTRKADARKLETDEKARRQRLPSGALNAPVTVADAWERVSPALSKRSQDVYGRMWTVLRPHVGKDRLDRVTRLRVAEVRRALEADYAPASVKLGLTLLGIIFNRCVDERWLVANPAKGATKGLMKAKVDDDDQVAEDLKFIGSAAEMGKALRAAPAGIARDVIAFGMFTGCRVGEVCAVDWSDVYLEKGKLCIRRSVKGPTKSGKSRWMPIQRQLRSLLERRALAQGRPERGPVFPELGGVVDPAPVVRRHLNDALEASGVGHFTTHEAFRHTFASHFVMAGGDIFRLAKYLGHSSVQITYQTYAHLLPGAFTEDEDRIQVPAFDDDVAEVIPLRG